MSENTKVQMLIFWEFQIKKRNIDNKERKSVFIDDVIKDLVNKNAAAQMTEKYAKNTLSQNQCRIHVI